jgi:3-methyladenine DNA glycosylase/8-oxoguanine DNA glycosylase
MAVTPRVFATEKQNAKIVPSQIIVDNELGAAQRIITIQDVFTTAASIVAATGVAVAAALQTVNRLIITVDNAGWATIAAEALKNLEILGQLQVTINVADAGTIVTISWGFE